MGGLLGMIPATIERSFAGWSLGLADLIGKGYNAMSYVFTAIVVVPLLTVGVVSASGPGGWTDPQDGRPA